PKSHEQNVLDGRSMTALQAKQTHCHRGHPLSGDNLRYTSAGGRVRKQCRTDWHELNRNRTVPPRPRARTLTHDVLLDAADGPLSQDPYKVLLDLHTKRVGNEAPRCRTCRDSKGRPTPWPCLTYAQLAAALGVELDL